MADDKEKVVPFSKAAKETGAYADGTLNRKTWNVGIVTLLALALALMFLVKCTAYG